MKTIKDIAQEMYPVENNAECYTAFLEGAEQGNKQAIQYVTDLLVSAFEHGKLTEREIKKVFIVMKEEIK
jgi:hypothetical protein